MSEFRIKGTIKVIKDTQVISDKFSKREFVISDDHETYPQLILFQSVQDKCSMLDGYKVGDMVEVCWNLKGRMWTNPEGEDRYFNTLDCWRIEKVDGSITKQYTEPSTATNAAEDDDLPF